MIVFLLINKSTYVNVSRTTVNITHEIVSTSIAKFDLFELC
jgi:hypothetical protein